VGPARFFQRGETRVKDPGLLRENQGPSLAKRRKSSADFSSARSGWRRVGDGHYSATRHAASLRAACQSSFTQSYFALLHSRGPFDFAQGRLCAIQTPRSFARQAQRRSKQAHL